jgi:hypothetical protein
VSIPESNYGYAITDKVMAKFSITKDDFVVREDHLECKACGHACKTVGAMENHVNLVHRDGARPYQCDSCPAAFPNASGLKTHAVKHVSGPVTCYCCDKSFPSQSHMQAHLKYIERFVKKLENREFLYE